MRWLPLLALLVGCPRSQEPERVGPSPLATPDEPGSDWVSEACGERAYERVLSLAADHSYSGQDLISPCPPTARCVWSGVVHFSGSWSDEGGVLVLVEEAADPGPGLAPRPTRLVLVDGLVAEEGPDGPCVYQRR